MAQHPGPRPTTSRRSQLKNRIRDFLERRTERSYFWSDVLLHARWVWTRINMVHSDYDFAQSLFRRRGETWSTKPPITFNDKLWLLKLGKRDPLLTECSDKHAVRDYVRRCGFPEILKTEHACFDTHEDIDFAKLPSPSYLKCNHGSGLNWVYRHGATAKELRHRRRQFAFLMKQNTYTLSREWNYKDIRPAVIAEEYLEMPSGGHIPELQFFCFHGEPKFLMYNLGLADDQGRHTKALRWVFDMDFNLLKVRTSMESGPDVPPKPAGFDEMATIAKTLSAPFEHVRVDLFDLEGRILFNELTFYSGGGFVKLEPAEWQAEVASWLDVDSYSIADDAKRGGLRRMMESFGVLRPPSSKMFDGVVENGVTGRD